MNHPVSTSRPPRWPTDEEQSPFASRRGLPSLLFICAINLFPAAVILLITSWEAAASIYCVSAASFLILRMRLERARGRFVKETLSFVLRDELTGLASRGRFLDELRATLERRIDKDAFTALLYIDLDSFKSINDTLGHSAGDQVLVTVASRLREVIREPNLVARMGGDELAVLCPELLGREDAIALADAIMRTFADPIPVGKTNVWANASVGIVLAGRPRPKSDDLLVMADTALYEAKNQGKGRYVLFEPGLPTPVTRSPSLEADLRAAVRNEEFVLHFQPIANLDDLSIAGFEALVRWNHPRRGLLGPGEFIPLAEETGHIMALGDWIVRRSFEQLATWRSLNSERLTMNINLSALQFRRRDLLTHLWRTCSSTGVPPASINLEITESFFLQDDEVTLMNLEGLGDLGFGLAIDDFGVGFSSLSYLSRFKINTLKIDKSFLPTTDEPRSEALGHSLNISVTAEGIETLDQLELLRRLDCDKGQGYLLSKPISEQEVLDRLITGAFLRLPQDMRANSEVGAKPNPPPPRDFRDRVA